MVSKHDRLQKIPSKDDPIPPLTLKEAVATAKIISTTAIPNILTTTGMVIKDLISMYFIGHLNQPSLFAAFGFGMAWYSGFVLGVIFGLAAGFGTLASQAYGAKNYKKLGLLYQKVFVVTEIIMAVVSILLWFTAPVLKSMGYEEDLANEVGLLMKILVPNALIYPLFDITKYYLLAQNVFDIPAYIVVFTNIVHIFWCHLFINHLNAGLIGVAVARLITDGSAIVLILLYAKYRNPNPESWTPWTSECLKDLGSFTKDLLSQGASIYIEWITFEITTVITGFLKHATIIAAHTSTLNFIFVNFSIPFGFTLSMSTLVANAAGEGSVQKAKKYAIVGLTLILGIVSILNILVMLFRYNISAFYTSDAGVQEATATILLIYSFGMIQDILGNALGYLLRGLGQDRFVVLTYIFSYYGITILMSLIFGLFFEVWDPWNLGECCARLHCDVQSE